MDHAKLNVSAELPLSFYRLRADRNGEDFRKCRVRIRRGIYQGGCSLPCSCDKFFFSAGDALFASGWSGLRISGATAGTV